MKKRLTTPFAHQGKVFAGSEEGTLYAVDGENGRRLWTFNVAQAVVVAAGAWEKRIFAASQDRSLYAIDIEEGECLWRFTTGGRIHAAPCLAHDVVYLGSADHKVYALQAARGRLLWSFATGGEVRTTPSEDHGLVFIGSRDRHLYVLSAIDGKELWRRQFFGYPSAAAARRGMVYLSAQGRVYGFSAADQKMRWFFPSGHSLATAPAVTPNRIYLGTLGGKLLCLKWQTLLPEQGATHLIRKFLAPDLEAPS